MKIYKKGIEGAGKVIENGGGILGMYLLGKTVSFSPTGWHGS